MTIKKEFFAGTYINEACQEAVDLAIANNDWVEFEFNGIQLITTPETNSNDLVNNFLAKVKERSDAYWTPERLKEKEIKEENDRRILNIYFAKLENVTSLIELLDWFCELEKVSFAHALLSTEQRIRVMKKCEFFQVQAGMNCIRKNESRENWEMNDKNFKIKYLLGQALEGTMTMGLPHQIIHVFAESFKK